MNYLYILSAILLSAGVEAKQQKQQAMYAARHPRIGRLIVADIPSDRVAPQERRRIVRQQTETVVVPIRTLYETKTTTNVVGVQVTQTVTAENSVTEQTTVYSTVVETVEVRVSETVSGTITDDTTSTVYNSLTETTTLAPFIEFATESVTSESTLLIDNPITVQVEGTTTLTLPTTEQAFHIETVWQTLYGEAETTTAVETTTGTVVETVKEEQTQYLVTETEYTATVTQTVASTLTL